MPRLFAALRPVTLLAAIPLAACAVPPPPFGPTVVAMPRSGEALNQFQADDLACRTYAQTRTAPPGATQAAANSSVVGSAATGTAVGAAAGALVGAASGNAGAGAAIGAGAGLLTGTAVGAGNASAITGGAQAQYDIAYAQCMTSKGDVIENPNPTAVAEPPAAYGDAYPDGYPYDGAYPYGGVIGIGPAFWGPRWHGGWHGGGWHGGFEHGPGFHGGFGHGGGGHGGGHGGR